MSRARISVFQRFAGRYASFAAARISLVIGRWFILVQSARHLTTDEFAALAAALSIAEILRALSDAGVDSYSYSRLGPPTSPVRITVRAALLLRVLLSGAVTTLAVMGMLASASRPQLLPVLALILATSVQSMAVALLQKRARFGAMAVLVLATLVASLSVDAVAYARAVSLSGMAVLLVTPDIAAAVIAAALARQSLVALGSRAWRSRRAFVRQLAPIAGKLLAGAAVSVLVILYSRLDVVVVRPLAGATQQAHYSAGFRLVEPAFLLFAIGSLALLAELGSGRNQDVRQLAMHLLKPIPGRLLAMLTGLAALCYLTGIFTARHVVGLTQEAGLLTGMFAAALPFRIANSMISALLQRLGRFDAVMHAAMINGIVTFSAAALLVWPLGATGVALAALIGEIGNTGYQRYRLVQQMNALSAIPQTPTASSNPDAAAATPCTGS